MLINLATEDELSEAVGVRLIRYAFGDSSIGHKLGKQGNGYLIRNLPKFRQMARREPVLILTDLDNAQCPARLIEDWSSGQHFPRNLLLRVAVRETEAWILADRDGMAALLGVSRDRIPLNPEELDDPKRFLLNLARAAPRGIRSELIVNKSATASQGIGYNRILSSFVTQSWNLVAAAERSISLGRALNRLRELGTQ